MAETQKKEKKGRLIIFVCIASLIAIVLLNFAETTFVVESTASKLKKEGTAQYHELADSYAVGISRFIDMFNGHMDLYVKSDAIIDGNDDEIIQWLLDHADVRDEDFAYIGFAGSDGKFITDLNKISDIRDRDYFQAIINRGEEFYVDNPVTSKTSGNTIVHITRAVKGRDGRLKGLVAAVVNIGTLSELLDDIDLGDEGAAILFSGDGTAMASNVSKERQIELTSDENLTKEFEKQRSIQGESGLFYEKLHGEEMLIIYEPVEGTPWNVLMMVSADQVYGHTKREIGNMMTVGGVILVTILLAILGVILIRSLWPLKIVEKTIRGIATGDADLTKRINIDSNNEIGRVVDSFNIFSEKLQSIIATMKTSKESLVDAGQLLQDSTEDTTSAISQIISNIENLDSNVNLQTDAVHQTAGAVNQIASNIESLNRMIESQVSTVTQASAAVEQMIGNINSVNSSVQKMSNAFTELEEKAVIGVQKQNDVNSKIDEIEKESQALQEANSVISGIAEQTNLLAMNAAIEAAHAGEAGKGFSVVADEIRKLSEDSSAQSQTIGTQLSKITSSIDSIVEASQIATDAFNEVSSGINSTTNLVREITNAMLEQNEGSKQIVSALNSMNDTSNEVKTSSFEMAEGNKAILSEIQNLQDATFKIKDGMDEMSAGARKINETGSVLAELSSQMKDSIEQIGEQVDKFKV